MTDYPRLGRYVATTPPAYHVSPVWQMLGLPVASPTQGSSGPGGMLVGANPKTPAAMPFRAETPSAPMKRLVPTQMLQGRM